MNPDEVIRPAFIGQIRSSLFYDTEIPRQRIEHYAEVMLSALKAELRKESKS